MASFKSSPQRVCRVVMLVGLIFPSGEMMSSCVLTVNG